MVFSKIKVLFFILFLAVSVFIPKHSFAVFQISNDDINVNISPSNPEPYQNVTVTVTSYATDLNKAFIEWKSGSQTLISGYGKIKYSLKLLGPNMTTSLVVSINPEGFDKQLTKSIELTPSVLDILWESYDGYVPPFYRGRSLPSSESFIKIVAIPNSAASKKMSYTWTREDKNQADASGYGKNSFIFQNDYLNKQEEISVTASSVGGGYESTKNIIIPMSDPVLNFYKKSPTDGVLYNKVLNPETVMQEDEITIVAEPYFMSIFNNLNKFSYTWMVNNEEISTPRDKTELTVRPSSRGGYALINLSIENVKTLFQNVSESLKINL